MNLADDLAKVIEKKVQIDEEYEELLGNKIYGELWKFFSFIDYHLKNIKNKTFIFTSEEVDRDNNCFKAQILFNSKYPELNKNPIVYLEIQSSFDSKFLEGILSNFCIGNNFTYKILSE